MISSEIEPVDLLERARRLNADALEQVHDRYYAEVFRYVRYRLSDERVCEDVTSEVFLQLLDALHRRRGPTKNLRGWLLGTASNLVNDVLRRRYKHKIDDLDEDSQNILATEGLPEEVWDGVWQQAEIRTALNRLTEEQQHVLALRFADELSLNDTAAIIGKKVNAVKALQFRALAALRRFLEEKSA